MLLVSAAPGLRVPRGHGAGSCYSQSASLPLPLPLNHNNALIQLQSAIHAAEQQASAGPELTGGDDGKLEAFISWLIANGVRGIGTEDSKAALYDGQDGERGVISLQDFEAGETVFEVPLRLALTDFAEDEESNRLLYEGAPWSIRLAAKLLRQSALGPASPWLPYIAVLPAHVPAPLVSFSWEELSAVPYAPVSNALHEASWLTASAYRAACEMPDALAGASSQEFEWALSVVHSRTFANAAEGGGVGVRMLCPLVDMLNHAGDEAQAPGSSGGLSGPRVAMDNVRWDVLAPSPADGRSGWAMCVSATRDISDGEELLLSYGERANDDFFVHYGFVPPANPHDELVLFHDLEEALDWHYDTLGREQVPNEAAAQTLYNDALDTARVDMDREVMRLQAISHTGSNTSSSSSAADAPSMSGPVQQASSSSAAGTADESEEAVAQTLPAEVLARVTQLKVASGSRVSGPLLTAFTAVSGGDDARAEAAVAVRAAQLLAEWRQLEGHSGSILQDLATLAVDSQPDVLEAGHQSRAMAHGAEADAGPDSGAEGPSAQYYCERLSYYHQAITQRFPSLLRVTSNGDTRSDAASTMSPVSTDATASYGSGSGVAGKSTKTPAGNAARFAAGKKQVSGLQAGASTVPSSPVHLPLSPMPHQDLLQRYAPASAAAPGGAGALHGNAARLTLQLLVYKKMLAWDLLLSSSASEDMLLAGLGLVLCSNDMNDT